MRKTILAIAVFSLINSSVLPAQNTLSLIQNPASAGSAPEKSTVDKAKYEIANAVYQKLVAARGDSRYPAPAFVMSKATTHGAKMDYDNLEITLEEKVYDVCAGFDTGRDAALAIILGHELIHYYEKHGWRRGFVLDYQKLDIGTKLDALQDDVVHETQADYLGGFLAYSAGFPVFDKCPDLIKAIYDAYKLPENIPNYPSLKDRQVLSQRTIQKLLLLVDVFDAANYLAALGRYSEARKYYQYILNEYQSRETYNNVGVCMLLEVLDADGPKMLYPVELDLRSRAGRGNSGFADQRQKLLHAALLQFDAAISLDPNYAPSYLNKACAYALLKDYTRARFYAETEALQRAKNPAYSKSGSDAGVLLGIIAAEKGDSVAARQYFEQEIAKNNPLASFNLNVLLKKEEAPASSPGLALLKAENIDGISLSSFSSDPQYDDKLTQSIDSKSALFQYPVPDKLSKVLICRDDSGDNTTLTFFHATGAGYAGKTAQGLGLGATAEEIEKAYKTPKRRIQTPQGQMLIYSRLIFILDGSGKLIKWVHYTQS